MYGFEPFGEYEKNISQDIIGNLQTETDTEQIIFPVALERQQFLRAMSDVQPDIVLGLGQVDRGDTIRVERRAINMMKKNTAIRPQKILRSGPEHYHATLPIEKRKGLIQSYNAGLYVCNFSLYILLDFFRGSKTRVGFLHVPREIELAKATAVISDILTETRKIWG
ncbi:MAG: hypothetical protein JWM56_1204 [Candidatus Peribacteria bacterium]|nr:hypothetical protein [Candidatus Peribacteria bacterium]